jgi:hypothetical protein
MKNILKVGNKSKKQTFEGTKALLKGRKPGLFVNFGKISCSWIWIRIPNSDPRSGSRTANQCGSGSTTLVF